MTRNKRKAVTEVEDITETKVKMESVQPAVVPLPELPPKPIGDPGLWARWKVENHQGFIIKDKYYIKTSSDEVLRECQFKFMFCPVQRSINKMVVDQRVAANVSSIKTKGEHMDFGEIKICVYKDKPDPELYLVDGQHRAQTIGELWRSHSHNVEFTMIIKVLNDESELKPYFTLINDSRRIDPVTVFDNSDDKELAEWIDVWLNGKDEANACEFHSDKVVKDDIDTSAYRPYLNHINICNIYREIKSSLGFKETDDIQQKKAKLKSKLIGLNQYLSQLDDKSLFSNLSDHAKKREIINKDLNGCYLGCLRPTKEAANAWKAIGMV